MRPRIIPVLLLDSRKRLVKTRRFSEEVYVGDPFNVIRIFNEKEVDEICVLDINASVEGRRPDVGFISELSGECFIPLSYGGGNKPVTATTPTSPSGVYEVLFHTPSSDSPPLSTLA